MSLLERVSTSPFAIDYGYAVEEEISRLSAEINGHEAICHAYPARWLALKLLERDLV